MFQIGKPDGDYREFAIAGDYAAFPAAVPSRRRSSWWARATPQQQWPFIHPGPTDAWAGGRPHAFKITFTLPDVVPGYYRLVVDFVSTHGASPPRLTLDINGTQLSRRLPAGSNDDALTNPKAGKKCSLQQFIPVLPAPRGDELHHAAQRGGKLGAL